MTTRDPRHDDIDAFANHYGYDAGFMHAMLRDAPAAYDKFAAFMPFATHREQLERDDYWIARLATMQAEDCGHCLQLNVDMAREAGVAPALIAAAVRAPDTLPPALAAVHVYARAVALHEQPPAAQAEAVQARLSATQLMELAICIAGARVFPAIKRALGLTRSCQLIDIST